MVHAITAISAPALEADVQSRKRETIESVPTVSLRGVRLHAITEAQCVRLILEEIRARRGGSVVTMNLDHLRRSTTQQRYAARCRSARIVTADGMPLIWASRLQRTPLPERVTGSNLIWSLSEAAARRRRSVFLLGGAPGAGERAAAALSGRYPKLEIAGVWGGSIRLGDEHTISALRVRLASANPDIVYVALGSPKQEELIDLLRDALPHSWWLGVGIAFSFVCGEIPRAPLWMQRTGFEWLHRLVQEPRRLAGRYLVCGLPFALSLLSGAVVRRFFDNPEAGNRELARNGTGLN